MKLTKYLAGFAAFAFAASAYAADVTVYVTGATAFRAAALTAIKAKYLAGNPSEGGSSFKFAHDKAALGVTGATRSIFIGKFPGVSGTTTISCCFTGSVEGIRALVLTPGPTQGVNDTAAPTYYRSTIFDSPAGQLITMGSTDGGTNELPSQGTNTADVLTTTSDIAFTDVSKASTPYTKKSVLPSDTAARAGVIVFAMVANKDSAVTNVTSQQFRALMAGPQPLSVLTGIVADNPDNSSKMVYAVGRNDGSGTRTTYLAETGFGIANPVKQYVVNNYTSTALSKIQLVPKGGLSTIAGSLALASSKDNISSVWGQDVDGNGGYNSGGSISAFMGKTGSGTSCTVFDATGLDVNSSTVDDVSLVSFLGLSDAVASRNNGGHLCAFNGVALSDVALSGTFLSTADKAKVTQGAYTAWGYERMYRNSAITSGDKLSVYNTILTEVPNRLDISGVKVTDMTASREVDGGVVAY